MTEEALQEFVKREFPAEMPVTEVADKLDTMQAHPDIEQIRIWFNNVLLAFITLDYLEYSENRKNFLKETSVQLFFRNTEKILGNPYFQAVACFFKGQYEKSLRLVRTVMKSNAEEEPYNLQELAYCYIVPFKNAFPGFWQMVVLQLKQSGAEQLVIEHAELVRDYYFAATEEEKCLLLTDFLQNHSDSVIAHELLGMTYGRMKRWKNQIACLETIEEQPCLFTKACINFQIGWAYGKEKDWEQEEAYYRNCLELEWDYPFANNNLAYSFYQQKRYAEAKELLEFCLEKELDLSCAANNYVRVLLAMGNGTAARSFIKSGAYPVSKSLVKRAETAKNRQSIVLSAESAEQTKTGLQKKPLEKAEQFSSEWILEEELTARIEAGFPVFGKQLHLYRRKGEYGRQYIIPIGRLDLFCEDADGNLYVIELKKDGGYGDAYAQLAAYLDWFQKSKRFSKHSVSGILCVNHPSPQLLQKVHTDARMRLYEYQISYTER